MDEPVEIVPPVVPQLEEHSLLRLVMHTTDGLEITVLFSDEEPGRYRVRKNNRDRYGTMLPKREHEVTWETVEQ